MEQKSFTKLDADEPITVGYIIDTEGYTVLTAELQPAAINAVDINGYRLPDDLPSSITLKVSAKEKIYISVRLLALPVGFDNHPMLRIAIYDKITPEYSEWFSVMTENLPPITVKGITYSVFALGGKILAEVEKTWPEFVSNLSV